MRKEVGKVTIGVLALQGAVAEHMQALSALGDSNLRIIAVRTPKDFEEVDGLVLPGGESTAMTILLSTSGLHMPMYERIQAGMCVWGTCAGIILLAKTLYPAGKPLFGVLDVEIERNAYGCQLDSFTTDLHVGFLGESPFKAICIRAPRIRSWGPAVEILATDGNYPMACRQQNMLGTVFHPELTRDDRFHRYFVDMVKQGL